MIFSIASNLLILATLISAKLDSSTIFYDPSGRLHQVEYAYKATQLGTTILAAKSRDYAIILTSTNLEQLKDSSHEKIHSLTPNLCLTASGISSDFTYIKDIIHSTISDNIYTFNTIPRVSQMVSSIAEIFHERTMSARYRPFGIRLLFVGYDDTSGAFIYEIDPMGNTYNCEQAFLGKCTNNMKSILNELSKNDKNPSSTSTSTTSSSNPNINESKLELLNLIEKSFKILKHMFQVEEIELQDQYIQLHMIDTRDAGNYRQMDTINIPQGELTERWLQLDRFGQHNMRPLQNKWIWDGTTKLLIYAALLNHPDFHLPDSNTELIWDGTNGYGMKQRMKLLLNYLKPHDEFNNKGS
eukprot:gene4921-9814_t